MATTRENRTISDFKSRLVGGGARPNLFEVRMTDLPDFVDDWPSETFQFMCKAAALPASNIAAIDVPFRGRIFKVAGDRTVDTWTITVINDEDFRIRNAMEQWMDGIAKLSNNLGATNPSSYMISATVFQLGRGKERASTNSDGERNAVLAEYEFIDIFPTNISEIALSYDSSDTIEEFTVEFQVQSFNLNASGGPDD